MSASFKRKSSRARFSHQRLVSLSLSSHKYCYSMLSTDITWRSYNYWRIVRRTGACVASLSSFLIPLLKMICIGNRNEVTHAQYTAQVCHRKTDALTTAQTAISILVSDEMVAIESSLSFFLSIWSRLQFDCNDILYWLQHPRGHPVRFVPGIH